MEYGLLTALLLVCAAVAPVILLFLMLLLQASNRIRKLNKLRKILMMLAHRIETWTMPEVYLLGVIIAYFKLSEFIDFGLVPAYLSYCALSFFLLLAWRQFSLRSDQLKGIKPGAPVVYRQVEVGEVENTQLTEDSTAVLIRIRIYTAYSNLVRTDTKFWNATRSPLNVSLFGNDNSGSASIESIVSGAIGFSHSGGSRSTGRGRRRVSS